MKTFARLSLLLTILYAITWLWSYFHPQILYAPDDMHRYWMGNGTISLLGSRRRLRPIRILDTRPPPHCHNHRPPLATPQTNPRLPDHPPPIPNAKPD
jgi:hypothetical protein